MKTVWERLRQRWRFFFALDGEDQDRIDGEHQLEIDLWAERELLRTKHPDDAA